MNSKLYLKVLPWFNLLSSFVEEFDVRDVHKGYTPFMIAVSEGYFIIGHKLIDGFASARLLSKSGENVYDIAKPNIARHLKTPKVRDLLEFFWGW